MRLLAITAVLAAAAAASDQIPGKQADVAITNVTLHPADGKVREGVTLVVRDGKIASIGGETPDGVQTVDGSGKHLYPGLFEAVSRMGLVEISAVRATDDFAESGRFNPEVKAHVAVNPDSEVIPVTRSNGVLLTMTVPVGGLIAGQGSVIQLDGWTTEDLTIEPRAGMVVNVRDAEDVEDFADYLDDARRYKAARDADESTKHDQRMEAMQAVLAGEQPVVVRANTAKGITQAVTMAVENGLNLIVFGGHDAEEVAPLLKKYGVPVIIDCTHRKPLYRHASYDAAYSLPARLKKAGVKFCIAGTDRAENWNTRNLPYHAGTAVAFGLSREDAIRAITLWPAEILGVADRVGSLTVGKDATMILTDGDPLETATTVEAAWVQGRPVDLDNKQRELGRKYRSRYAD